MNRKWRARKRRIEQQRIVERQTQTHERAAEGVRSHWFATLVFIIVATIPVVMLAYELRRTFEEPTLRSPSDCFFVRIKGERRRSGHRSPRRWMHVKYRTGYAPRHRIDWQVASAMIKPRSTTPITLYLNRGKVAQVVQDGEKLIDYEKVQEVHDSFYWFIAYVGAVFLSLIGLLFLLPYKIKLLGWLLRPFVHDGVANQEH